MKFKKHLPLIILSLMLVSCGSNVNRPIISIGGNSISSSDTSINNTTINSPSSPSSSSNSSSSSSSSSSSKVDVERNITSSHSTYQLISQQGNGRYTLPSIGEAKILVVPVEFTDYRFARIADSKEDAVKTIEDAFFGERSEDAEVESVASFYKKSSYGKLNITGVVSDVITAPRTYSYYSNIRNEYLQIQEVENIAKEAMTTLDETMDLLDFDTDGDEYFDAIWIINSAPVSQTNVFWAFTTWANFDESFDNNYVGGYAWAGYGFFSQGYNNSYPDTHTIIHETGHLLGLDDYYNYDSSSFTPSYPAGALDMMDYNIGDHMAFSKYDLGWIEPSVISEDGTYTLKPITESGESYIIAAPNYNDSPFWEYYILEYYTPTVLNKNDSEHAYTRGYPTMYSSSGLRVYRVNQKIGYLNNNFDYSGELITNINNIRNNEPYVVLASNSQSRSYLTNKSTKLVRLISADPYYSSSRIAENKDLFTEGSEFDSGFVQWEDTSLLNFTFTIDEVNSTSLSFTFTKTA